LVNRLLAKTEPTPPLVNFLIVPPPTFATKRLPALSKAIPVGVFTPLLAKTEPTPSLVNFEIVEMLVALFDI
jgi:hypothetical protein